MKPFIIILTGPSCAGKTTLETMLKGEGFVAAISTTTRSPRAGEVDGQTYYFVTPERFNAIREEGGLVESVEFNGNCYGLSKAEVERISSYGAPLVVVCEPHGRDQIINFCNREGWEYHSVYVGNPEEVIAERFLKRVIIEVGKKPESVEQIVKVNASRLATMMTVERAWVVEAFFQRQMPDGDFPYDRILTEFNAENAEKVVEDIVGEYREFSRRMGRLAA